MKLSKQEIQMFKVLREVKGLAEYLERLEGDIHDSRNWEEGMTRETAQLAAKPLKKFRSYLKSSIGDKAIDPNEYL